MGISTGTGIRHEQDGAQDREIHKKRYPGHQAPYLFHNFAPTIILVIIIDNTAHIILVCSSSPDMSYMYLIWLKMDRVVHGFGDFHKKSLVFWRADGGAR
jgi:hypothetical protein